jgi:hypothetical protein
VSHGSAFHGARDEPPIAFHVVSSQEERLTSLLSKVKKHYAHEYHLNLGATFKIRAKYVALGSSAYALNHV